MLIVLGAMALRPHTHRRPPSGRRPVVVGAIHGLAGSAFVAMLVLGAAESVEVALLYLGAFGVGTAAGMGLITAGVAVPAAIAARRFASAPRVLQVASGVASIAFGLLLGHQVGFEDGLFTGNATWTPQ
jgi:high-affinity nickel-transport protein